MLQAWSTSEEKGLKYVLKFENKAQKVRYRTIEKGTKAKIAMFSKNTNSYKILTDNDNPIINEKILNMIGRFDMARNLKSNLISIFISFM